MAVWIQFYKSFTAPSTLLKISSLKHHDMFQPTDLKMTI